ncbi:hypothetical protein BH09SUM1_BH09SUM1_32760 [soil metagenome]
MRSTKKDFMDVEETDDDAAEVFGRLADDLRAMPLPPLIPPVRVAALLGLDRRRIYEMIKVGELPAVKQGVRGLRIVKSGLLEWLERGGSGNGELGIGNGEKSDG